MLVPKVSVDSNRLPFITKSHVVTQLKGLRLQVLNPIVAAFNIADFEALSNILLDRCNPNVLFSVQDWQCTAHGVMGLFVCWSVFHEIHPDAVLEILERRTISSPSCSKADSSSSSAAERSFAVEYVCRLAGTRVTTNPLSSVYKSVLKDEKLLPTLNHESLSTLVIRHLSALGVDHSCEQSCVYILEFAIHFDQSGKICEWIMNTLATDVKT